MPPRTHDLLYLVRELDLAPPRTHLDFIGIINNASVPTRYPEDLCRLVSEYRRRTALSYMARTSRVLTWLRRHPSLARK
jgi:HEPN domain-containing protein